ncbi:MAG: signal peptidase II [Clostridia bacterium]|nr:signal peptidase II [Clostridia bacterium]
MLLWILMIVALVVVDQVSKLMVHYLLAPVGSVDVIPNVFRFTYVENRGAAFGMFSEHRWVFMVISVVAILALLIYLWKFRPDSALACAAMSMIIAGGIGNMIDRVALGYVIDFLDFCAFPTLWMWVFNVADVCVCVGGGLLVLWLIISMVADYKKEKAAKAQQSEENKTE